MSAPQEWLIARLKQADLMAWMQESMRELVEMIHDARVAVHRLNVILAAMYRGEVVCGETTHLNLGGGKCPRCGAVR